MGTQPVDLGIHKDDGIRGRLAPQEVLNHSLVACNLRASLDVLSQTQGGVHEERGNDQRACYELQEHGVPQHELV